MKWMGFAAALAVVLTLAGCRPNEILIREYDGYTVAYQTKGPDLGFSPASGLELIYESGYAFKDLDPSSFLPI